MIGVLVQLASLKLKKKGMSLRKNCLFRILNLCCLSRHCKIKSKQKIGDMPPRRCFNRTKKMLRLGVYTAFTVARNRATHGSRKTSV